MPILRILVRKFLLGLDYLHRYCKLIHTDLKPENVLLKLTEAEIIDIKQRSHKVEDIMKKIGHKY
jgi:serine/threonine-protein kinase SRPK3